MGPHCLWNQIIKILSSTIFTLGLLLSGSSYSEGFDLIRLVPVKAKSELWINPGLLSMHFDRSRDFNAINYGLGMEYKNTSVTSFTVGRFRNSNYQESNYAGFFWQPVGLGPFNLGLVAGGFNGYTNTNNGGWFPAILPVIFFEGERIGFNLMLIPTVPNQIAGSLSLQMKVKVFDWL